jgi:hypothetical protein
MRIASYLQTSPVECRDFSPARPRWLVGSLRNSTGAGSDVTVVYFPADRIAGLMLPGVGVSDVSESPFGEAAMLMLAKSIR